ncbi:MAG: histidine kinase [Lachnospiraceae bacterium]|nr:histidine kinase [Lachnospiraceae bacterium]
MKQQNLSSRAEYLEKMQDELAGEIHSRVVKMQTIYTETALTNNMRNRLRDGSNLKKFYWEASDFAESRFDLDDGLQAVYIYDSKDKVVSVYRSSVTAFAADLYEGEDEINAEALKTYVDSDTSELFVSGYYNRVLKDDVIRIVMKLHEYSGVRTQYGYLVCEFDSSVFKNVMQKYITTKDEVVWLQGVGDIPICSAGNEEKGLALFAELSEELQQEDAEKLKSEYGGFYLTESSFDKYNLHTYMLTSKAYLYSTLRVLIQILVGVAIIMTFIASVIGIYLSTLIAKPIEELKGRVVRIAEGEMELRIDTSGWSEELVVLGTEFNNMLDQIQDMIFHQYENQLLMERTEYQALQAQINPHFLYNTLNTMSGIAVSQNCPMVSELCQALSGIFRYSINISDTLATVQEELQHVQNYLYVMDVRHGFIDSYSFDVPGDVLKDLIPRISIQPIVENALNHGLRFVRGREKKLEIVARHKDGELWIEIKDNGVGMDTEEINAALEANQINRIEKGDSIGILNVNARIKMAFGESYGLFYQSAENEGTCVTIRIPIMGEGADFYGDDQVSGVSCG